MESNEVLENVVQYVKTRLKHAESGHDWWHIERVWKLANKIAETEKVDKLVVQLGALLHDIADPKFNNGNELEAEILIRNVLTENDVSAEIIRHVVDIVNNVSFKGGNVQQRFRSKELDVVQDADRLDAIGAIGIARTFGYGGFKNREMYNPSVLPKLDMTKEEYRSSTAPTINHFYEKLLLLKDRMNTETARKMAEHRHRFMEDFLTEFYAEWNGEK